MTNPRRRRPGPSADAWAKFGMEPPGEEMHRSIADDERAERRAEEIAALAPPKLLRSRAIATVRCQDCKGMPIAYTTRMDGRLAVWTRPKHATAATPWPARYFGAVWWGASDAWCRAREWDIPPEAVGWRGEVRVSHADPDA